MRTWGAVVLAAVMASALPAASAQMCKVNYNGMAVEYPCGSGEAPAEEPPADDPWYASLDIWLGILGLAASGGAGAYALFRVRTRRRALTVTLAAIESTYAEAKADPENGITRLSELRAQVREEHQKGRLDDVHFIELDRRATQYLVKLRLLEIDRRFGSFPALFLAEIRRLLSDGVLSASEADLIEVRAAAYRVPETARMELISLTRRWASEDGPREAPTPEPVAP